MEVPLQARGRGQAQEGRQGGREEPRNRENTRNREPEHVLKVRCVVSTEKGGSSTLEYPQERLTWTIDYACFNTEDDLRNVRVILRCDGQENRTFKVETQIFFEHVFEVGMTSQIDRHIFDESRRSMMVDGGFSFAKAREQESLNAPRVAFNLYFLQIVEISEFSFHNLMLPLSTHWISYGNDRAIRMRLPILQKMNRHFVVLWRDLAMKLCSMREGEAFFDFIGTLFNGWYQFTDKYGAAMRNGYKLGFTQKWEYFDKADTHLDFLSRTILPLYQSFSLERQPVTVTISKARSVVQSHLICLESIYSFQRYELVKTDDQLGIPCQFSMYLKKTNEGRVLLLGGANFQPKDGARHKITVKIALMFKTTRAMEASCSRMIDQNHRSMGMVLGEVPEEILEAFRRKEKLTILFTFSKSDTNALFLPNYQSYLDSKELAMPGPVDGFLICRGGEKIGVNRSFLSTFTEYFHTHFFSTNFVDCGTSEVQVDEEFEIVWSALNILWHKSQVLHPATFERVLMLGDHWMSDVIKNYVELAMLQTVTISPMDKRDIGATFNLDVVNYVLRHPDYASNYRIQLPPFKRRVITTIKDHEIDGGVGRRIPGVHRIMSDAEEDDSNDDDDDWNPRGGPGGPRGSAGSSGGFGQGTSGSAGPSSSTSGTVSLFESFAALKAGVQEVVEVDFEEPAIKRSRF